jgi:hypothetical protein
MKFSKKKNLQRGEEILYRPGVHWVKVLAPLLLLGTVGLLYGIEALFRISRGIPPFITLALLVSLTLYFLLQALENAGILAGNKWLAALTVLCPLFLADLIFGTVPSVAGFVGRIGSNANYILLTLLILSAVHFFIQVFEYVNTEYYITNKRLLVRRGILSDSITDITIDKLEGMVLVQDFWGSIFNYGSIRLSGTGGRQSCLSAVWKPFAVRRMIDTVIEKNRGITIIHDGYSPPPPPPPEPAQPEVPEAFKYGTLVRMLSQEK